MLIKYCATTGSEIALVSVLVPTPYVIYLKIRMWWTNNNLGDQNIRRHGGLVSGTYYFFLFVGLRYFTDSTMVLDADLIKTTFQCSLIVVLTKSFKYLHIDLIV